MASPILTSWGHGQSEALFLKPRRSHVMRKPTLLLLRAAPWLAIEKSPSHHCIAVSAHPADIIYSCGIAANLSSAAWRTRNSRMFSSPSLSAQPATVRIPCSTSIRRNSGSGVEAAMSPRARSNRRLTATSALRIHADLLEGRVQQALEVDPSNAGANDARRIVEQIIGRLPGREADQDAAQLIHAADGGGGVVDGGRDRLQRDIDDLQDAKLHVLLQGSGRTEVERGAAARRFLPAAGDRPSRPSAAGFPPERIGRPAGARGCLTW